MISPCIVAGGTGAPDFFREREQPPEQREYV